MDTNTIKLDAAFSEFWIRIDQETDPLDVITMTSDAIMYYLALSHALDRQDLSRLRLQLECKTPVPPEFLPIISLILGGKLSRGGRKPKFTRIERINIYRLMCYEKYVNNRSLEEIYHDLSEGTELDPNPIGVSIYERIWKDCVKDEDVPKFYKNGA